MTVLIGSGGSVAGGCVADHLVPYDPRTNSVATCRRWLVHGHGLAVPD
jgi:hypothetical protein